MRLYKLILLVLALLFLAAGCSGIQPDNYSDLAVAINEIRLTITSDFGTEILFDEMVSVPAGTSAIDAVRMCTEITTAYGGGFITSINGIKSGYMLTPVVRSDWFLYVNGMLTNTGGQGYITQPGDTIHWYYRNWSFRQNVSALVSDFPQPFLNGYAGRTLDTLIIYQPGYSELADITKKSLSDLGIGVVHSAAWQDVSPTELQTSNLIVIGDTAFTPVEYIGSIWDKIGLFATWQNGEFSFYGPKGEPVFTSGSDTGVIMAMQNPYNPRGTLACENVLWLITGTGFASIQACIDVLINEPYQLKYNAGILVENNQVRSLPQPLP